MNQMKLMGLAHKIYSHRIERIERMLTHRVRMEHGKKNP
nr:MAG TPA: hypothetical protein [Caudoviricetes sp.]